MTTPTAPNNHIGKALQVLALIGALAGGCAFFVKVGMWIAQVQTPPAAIALPPELATEVGACRELLRVLRAGPVPRREHP